MNDNPEHLQKLGDIAATAGIRRIHMLAWRDLDDVEAGGSEVHAAEVARLWAEAGLEVVLRTSYAQGHTARAKRDGYEVIRKAGRYMVFPRAAASEAMHRYGQRDALVEIWNGMPFFSPLWATGPRVVFLHHVHADMWKMVLPPNLARLGDTVERRIAPRLYHRSRMITLSPSSRDEMVEVGFDPRLIEVVPPGIGIVHQVNLEYLARGVHKTKAGVYYPDSLVGTWPYSTPKGWQVSPWTSDWYELQPWEKDVAPDRNAALGTSRRRRGW